MSEEFAPPPAPRAPKPRARSAKRRVMRALLAEDNDVSAVVAQKALRRLGFDVARARDGEEAIALAGAAARGETPPYEVALMDIRMPGADGFAAARALRRFERETGVRRAALIALSADAAAEDERAGAEAGFDAFLTKPVDLARLAEAIERTLAGAPPLPLALRARRSQSS
jgi:CheY-like chemotaxis protein